jgi:molecular chaperone DnaJ
MLTECIDNLNINPDGVYVDATLGGEIMLKGIDGDDIKVEIKAGTQPNDKLRLKNKGMKYMNFDRRGDLFVIFRVVIPTKLNAEQKACLLKFREKSPDEEKSFWSRIFD